MHEYSIIDALIRAVETEVAARRARTVSRVKVRVGQLSGVDCELLGTAFEIARDETICRDAQLEIHSVAAVWACPSCRGLVAQGEVLKCLLCDVPAELTSGDEIILEQIEMEVA